MEHYCCSVHRHRSSEHELKVQHQRKPRFGRIAWNLPFGNDFLSTFSSTSQNFFDIFNFKFNYWRMCIHRALAAAHVSLRKKLQLWSSTARTHQRSALHVHSLSKWLSRSSCSDLKIKNTVMHWTNGYCNLHLHHVHIIDDNDYNSNSIFSWSAIQSFIFNQLQTINDT